MKNNEIICTLKKIWRTITPIKFRTLASRIRTAIGDTPMIVDATYADDRLISQNVTDFLKDKKFIQSYNLGKEGGGH